VLSRLVGLSERTFAENYWGQRVLFSRSADLPAGFDDLFTLAAVDELLSVRGLRTPFIRLVKDGAVVEPSRYTRSGGIGAEIADQVVDDRVLELFAGGHTVVLQGLHRLWPPLVAFAGDLTAELGHPVQINAYITPSQSQGFRAHYDVHDVFVLQIAGEKRWIVHEPVHPDPLRTQPWTDRRQEVAARTVEAPLLDEVLRPGDVLYLPRGFIHSAEALGATCAHLTVGVQSHTRHTLVEALARLAADDPALRASLPLGLDVRDPDDLADELRATIEALVRRLGDVAADDVARDLEGRTRFATRAAPLAPLAQADAIRLLDADAVVQGRAHLRATCADDGARLVVTALGRSLTLDRESRAAMEAILSTVPVRVGDLPGLDEAAAVALVRELLIAGVAVPASD
jgi:ribosomal protein L16 Arg81 hydroxylase